ncbi:alpha/beta hydrolase, partial [Mesorhizobium sp. M4B.F.Ca.ET.203.01.1.1]
HPPTFIAYYRAPGRGEESKAFAERLRATGTKVTLFDGSAYTHMSINGDFGEDGDALTAAALAFLKATVG